jgi:heme/copper-type cytochrome/quinol oxidase subunit 2
MNESSIQESIPQPISNSDQLNVPKLWNPEAVGAWSLIFNPVFGSILVLMNWQALGEKEKVRNAQLWLAVSIVVLVAVIFLPPSIRSLVSISYLLLWYFSAAKPQARYFKERWGTAYPRRSWLWPLLIGFGIIFGAICVIAAATLVAPPQ